MLCKNCGGTLKFTDGLYVCEHCHSRYDASGFYENIDVYICYVEADETGRRTKDSVLAQDIYRTLEQAKIKTFYARISADRLAANALETACNAAISKAKVVLLLGSQKRYFETLSDEYAGFFAGKIVVPVYTDMDAYDIPRDISSIQALDYSKVGAGVDLTRSIRNALGLEEEPDYSRKAATGKKVAIWACVAGILLIALFTWLALFRPWESGSEEKNPTAGETVQPTLSAEEIQANQYADAVACAEAEDYVKAIELFLGLQGYKDSDKQLHLLYQRYAGYYQDAAGNISLRLQVWEGNAGSVELSGRFSGAMCSITEVFQMQGSQQSLDFTDSEGNDGTITLTLENGTIKVQVETTNKTSQISMGTIEAIFSVDEKSDKPFAAKIDGKVLLSWLDGKTSLKQVQRQGYELEYDTGYGVYKIKNTEVSLVAERLYSEDGLSDEPYIQGVSAPAGILIPNKMGRDYNAFYEDNFLYVPNSRITSAEGWWFESIEGALGKISDDTLVGVTSRMALLNRFDDWLWGYLGECVEEIVKNEYADSFSAPKDSVESDMVAENEEYYLIKVKREGSVLYAYYTVSKVTLELKMITDASDLVEFGIYDTIPKKMENDYTPDNSQYETTDGENISSSVDFYVEGTWWDMYSKRCSLHMNALDSETVQIVIRWSSSAFSSTTWYFVAKWNADTKQLNYEKGIRLVTESLDGQQKSNVIQIYNDGTGYFYFEEGYLYWVDNKENTGENCYFVSPEE